MTVNVGYGRGYSVREVIASVKRVSGVDFTVVTAARRAGDSPMLIAKTDKIRSIFEWTPRFDSLDKIVEDALRWERKLHG